MNRVLISRRIAIVGAVSAGVACAMILGLYTNVIKLPVTRYIQPLWIADFTDDQKLVGASHHVFVGRVNRQVGSESIKSVSGADVLPMTQFEVEVVANVKGNLSGNVIVDQEGGYLRGILYLMRADAKLPTPADGTANPQATPLLTPGSTYIFATRYNDQNNRHHLISHPSGLSLLTDNPSLTFGQLEVLASGNPRVLELRAAYPNEVLFIGDVRVGNTRNSYLSTAQSR